MTLPNLIHPVPIRLRRQVPASTVFDPLSREPVRQVWREGDGPGMGSEIALVGQVSYVIPGEIRRPRRDPGGTVEESSGYVLVRVFDLIAAAHAVEVAGVLTIYLSRGDRFTRIGRRAVNYFLLFFRDLGHYTANGGSTLLQVHFGDRDPESPGVR